MYSSHRHLVTQKDVDFFRLEVGVTQGHWMQATVNL